MKIIIAGGRDFNDYEKLKTDCDFFISENKFTQIEIVSGRAKGADTLGEEYAKEKIYAINFFPADWSTNGKVAGLIRNREMAEYADVLIAFWDGKSRGTLNMIQEAKKKKLKIFISRY